MQKRRRKNYVKRRNFKRGSPRKNPTTTTTTTIITNRKERWGGKGGGGGFSVEKKDIDLPQSYEIPFAITCIQVFFTPKFQTVPAEQTLMHAQVQSFRLLTKKSTPQNIHELLSKVFLDPQITHQPTNPSVTLNHLFFLLSVKKSLMFQQEEVYNVFPIRFLFTNCFSELLHYPLSGPPVTS